MPRTTLTGGGSPSVTASNTGPWGSTGSVTSSVAKPTCRVAFNGSRPGIATSIELYVSGKGGSISVKAWFGGVREPSVSIPSGGSASTERTLNMTDVFFEGNGNAVSYGFQLPSGSACYFGRDSSGSTSGPGGGSWNGDLSGHLNWVQCPTAPLSFSVKSAGVSAIKVGWAAPSDNGGTAITGYLVQRATNAAFTTGVVSADVAAGTLEYEFTGLATTTTYYFRVLAKNAVTTAAGTYGPASGTLTQATQGTPVGAPSLPASPSLSQTAADEVTLSWSVPESDGGSAITGYDVQLASDVAFTAGVVNASKTNVQFSHVFTGVTEGERFARVRAKNAAATGNWTTPLPVVVAAPSGFRVYVGTDFIEKPLKVYLDGTFVEKPLKRYSEGTWITAT